jgi:hypothetical protein
MVDGDEAWCEEDGCEDDLEYAEEALEVPAEDPVDVSPEDQASSSPPDSLSQIRRAITVVASRVTGFQSVGSFMAQIRPQ